MTHNPPETRVSGRYGAPMGRVADSINCLCGSIGADWQAFELHRVRIGDGGYDSGGAYWGHGEPLFYWATESAEKIESRYSPGFFRYEEASGYIRAPSRYAAMLEIKNACPGARFKSNRA